MKKQNEYVPVFKWTQGPKWAQDPSRRHVKRVTKKFSDLSAGDLFWYKAYRVWRPWEYVCLDRRCSTHAPCRSLKALKRHLRKHYTELVGHEMYSYHSVSGTRVNVTWKKNKKWVITKKILGEQNDSK